MSRENIDTQISALHREYDELHEQIIRGNLRILKQELIHILYKLYLHQFKILMQQFPNTLNDEAPKRRIAQLFQKKIDFHCIPQYAKEISHIEPIITRNPQMECLKIDEDTQKIFCSHYIIYLSQHTYEVLVRLREKIHFKSIDRVFFTNSEKGPELVVVKN